MWLLDLAFNKLVTDFWRSDILSAGYKGWDKLADRLRRLKILIKKWERAKKRALKEELQNIEDNISKIYKDMLQDPPNSLVYSTLEELESRNPPESISGKHCIHAIR